MLHASGLVPARFLLLVAHFILATTLLLSRRQNVLACLPMDHTTEDYDRKDVQLATGLGVGIGLIVVELLGFLSGVSMFAPSVMLLSIGAHASASVALAYFSLDVWDCDLYWWVFGFCSALPAVAELLLLVGVLGLKKSV